MKNQPSTDVNDRKSPAKLTRKLQSTLRLTEPPPTLADWVGAMRQPLISGGAAAFWGGAYVALTGLLMFAGALGTVYAAMVVPQGPATIVVIFILTIGSFAASPTVARLILIRVHRNLSESSATRANEAAEIGSNAVAQRSGRVKW